MIAEMMADMRAEYERREEALHREIARLTLERDEALARTLPPPPQPRCVTCGVAVALLALLVALLLPGQPPPQVDAECPARLEACWDEVHALVAVEGDDDADGDVCELEGEGGASPMP